MTLKINDLLEKNKRGRTHDVLVELKELNLKAKRHMLTPRMTFKIKYKYMPRTSHWARAKELNFEYLLLTSGRPKCPHCGKFVIFKYSTLHHNAYVIGEYYSPPNVDFLHSSCHSKVHRKKKKKN